MSFWPWQAMDQREPEQVANEPRPGGGLDAFVSYSRRDQDFVVGLTQALEQRGRNVWIDADDIPAGAPWRRELGTGIEAADVFVFVISPDSVASPECAEEVDRALALGKRLVPVLYRPATGVPDELAAIQYIDAQGGGSERVVEQLDQAITVDQDWVREHTEWLALALRWSEGGRERSRLLRGSELDAAERWLTRAAGGQRPRPTELQAEYIAAGRRGERRRIRNTGAAATAALAVAVALAVLALIARNDAAGLRDRARSGEVAARASEQVEVDPERGLLLALEARAIGPSPLADDALRRALPLSHVRAVMRARGSPVSDFTLSRDGGRLITADGDGIAYVFDTREGGRPISALRGHRGRISAVELAPNGRRVITAAEDGSAHVWDLDDGRSLLTLRHDGRPIRSASFSADGERILTAGDDGRARVWDADSGRRLALLGGTGHPVEVASFNADGRTVLTGGGDGTARIWEPSSARGAVLARYGSPVFRASFSPDGRRALTIDAKGTARIWETASRRLLRRLGGTSFNGYFSPDGGTVATTRIDGGVTLWDVETGASTRLVGHGAVVTALAFSANGKLVATGGQDQTARVWDADQGAALTVLRGHVGGVVAVAFSRDGRTLRDRKRRRHGATMGRERSDHPARARWRRRKRRGRRQLRGGEPRRTHGAHGLDRRDRPPVGRSQRRGDQAAFRLRLARYSELLVPGPRGPHEPRQLHRTAPPSARMGGGWPPQATEEPRSCTRRAPARGSRHSKVMRDRSSRSTSAPTVNGWSPRARTPRRASGRRRRGGSWPF